MRAAKIVATVGPASVSEKTLRELLEAGANVFRFNLSHGDLTGHAERIRTVRALSAEAQRHIAVLIDLQGPKIRLGKFAGGGCVLETGQRFTITVDPVLGNIERASTTYQHFGRDVRPGSRVLLNDGAVELRVLNSDGHAVLCEVLSGGPVSDNKGINLPGVDVSSPSLTPKDRADLEYMLREPVDLVALSFVRNGEDVLELRRFLEQRGSALPIIAKIEKPQAWDNLDAVLEAADGIMVARGDLGVEVALEKVPFMQKAMITRARAKGRFVITATQMLESMVSNPAPTRAEVSDVANAIADGTDAVMLSAETSVGRYPVEAVRRMASIVEEAERSLRDIGYPGIAKTRGRPHAELIAAAAFEAAQSGAIAAIVVFTLSGSSARLVARYRPPVPVFAFTPSEAVARQLAVVHGLTATLMPDLRGTDEIISHVNAGIADRLPRNSSIAVVAGLPPGQPGNTNLLRLHRLE